MERYLAYEGAAGLDCYLRLFNGVGNVFDFADNQFRSLATAATSELEMTERTAMNGTDFSVYLAAIDFDDVNDSDEPMQIFWRVYDNATPADSDVSISELKTFLVAGGRIVPETLAHVTQAVLDQMTDAKVIASYTEIPLLQRTGIPPA